MFQDSLLESGGRRRTRRGLTTAVSLLLQTLLIGLLILAPLVYTEALPKQQLMALLTAPSPPPPAPAPAPDAPRNVKPPESELAGDTVRLPSSIPHGVRMVTDEEPPSIGTPNGVIGSPGSSDGRPDGVIGSILATTPMAPPTIRPPQRVVLTSELSAGMLVRRVQPRYPRLAVEARIQGTVVLQAVIGKDGAVQNLRVVSGHPMLAKAALEAVSQWRYRPYLLNQQPVEVETQVQVIFVLLR